MAPGVGGGGGGGGSLREAKTFSALRVSAQRDERGDGRCGRRARRDRRAVPSHAKHSPRRTARARTDRRPLERGLRGRRAGRKTGRARPLGNTRRDRRTA